MKSMNRKKGKKIAVIAAIIMGLMVFAFTPMASAAVTSFTVTPSTGLAGAVDSYNALVTTTGVTSINITIPAGFIAVAPTGGVLIAEVNFWNSSTKAYYGYATIKSNSANPTTHVDVLCKLGGDEITTTQPINYTAGATNTFESGFACDTSSAIIKLPTETVDGCMNITINCTGCPCFNDTWRLDDVHIAIKQSVRNPSVAKVYNFYADGQLAPVNIISQEGAGSAVFRAGSNALWLIDTTGNHKTNTYFWFGTTGDVPVVGDFTGNMIQDYGIFRAGPNALWLIDTTGDHSYNLCFWFGTTGDVPVVGDFTGNGIDDYGIFRNGEWFIDTTGNQKANQRFWFGTTGDVPVVGDFNGDGIDDYGIFRAGPNALWLIDTTGDRNWNLCFWFGTTGDVPVVGDFNGDGTEDYGVFRNGEWFIDTTGNQKANKHYWYGIVNDIPVAWDI